MQSSLIRFTYISAIIIVLLVASKLLLNLDILKVVGNSMATTIEPEDYVIVRRWKLIPDNRHNYSRGDLVITQNKSRSLTNDAIMLKRVFGVPLDTLFLFSEFALAKDTSNFYFQYPISHKSMNDLHSNESKHRFTFNNNKTLFFSKIDNIELTNSLSDSFRHNNQIVLGKSEYFLLGDNWSSSLDSRDFGAVSKEYIYGKVLLIINKF